MPATISTRQASRIVPRVSPNSHIPTSTEPIAPMPVHTT